MSLDSAIAALIVVDCCVYFVIIIHGSRPPLLNSAMTTLAVVDCCVFYVVIIHRSELTLFDIDRVLMFCSCNIPDLSRYIGMYLPTVNLLGLIKFIKFC